MTKIIAITGGIGSGKTTLCKYLIKTGFFVHESDKFVSEMYDNPSKSFIKFLCKHISHDVVKKGKVDKKKIAETIFNNNETRNKIEKYIHKKAQTY